MAPTPRPVELNLPADPRLLRVARLTVASVAADLPLTLEDVEDLRIAVDELAALAIDGCGPDATLQLQIAADERAVTVVGRVAGAGPFPPMHPVAAELIAMVAVDHEMGSDGDDRTFRFTKRVQVPTS
ncbi:MAG: Anti-sigma factor [Ilumatobacteraceae bacterium]|nr:Anti-sigma factor [Ilumatobacteraceae bacterium]